MGVAAKTRVFRARHGRPPWRRAPPRAPRGRIPGARAFRVAVTSSTGPGKGDIFIEQLAVTFSLDSDSASRSEAPGLVPRWTCPSTSGRFLAMNPSGRCGICGVLLMGLVTAHACVEATHGAEHRPEAVVLTTGYIFGSHE